NARGASTEGELSATMLAANERLGGFLFDELLPYDVKTALRRDIGALTISLDVELMQVPWELLHTGDELLSHRWSMSRALQLPASFEIRAEAAAAPSMARVLIVADPDGSLDESYAEGVAVHHILKSADGVDASLRAADVDASVIRQSARRYDVIHFAGHVDAAGWRMAESVLNAASVRRLAGGGEVPSLVFVNGCGAAGGEHAAVTQAWLEAGVPHVIAPLFDVPDRLARDFSQLVYRSLLAGDSIGDAVRAARLDLAQAVGAGATSWAGYVLFGDPCARFTAEPQNRKVVVQSGTRLSGTEPRRSEATRAEAAPISTAWHTQSPPTRFSFEGPTLAILLACMVLLALAAMWWLQLDGSSLFWGDVGPSTFDAD
ncbi:MAG: hypothetical protein ACI81R_000884, partial [Bradymonadia bacterium]